MMGVTSRAGGIDCFSPCDCIQKKNKHMLMHTWLALSDLYAFTQKHAHVWYHLQLTGITYPAAADQLQKQKRLESSAWTNTLLLSLSINGSWTVFKKSFLVSPTTQSLLQRTPAFTHIRSA